MNILKPIHAFNSFSCNESYIDRFNICTFADNLRQGESAIPYTGYHLDQIHWNGKHFYDKLPRCVKFNKSEFQFKSLTFKFDAWYDYDFDTNEIYKDYFEEFFRRSYKSKKVLNLYNKMKKNKPELFI